jgi:hypothetical protein
MHYHTVWEELLHHLPYAIFSVALAMIFLTLFVQQQSRETDFLAYRLFHNFHYLHLLFAATGTMLMFRRYSSNKILGLSVGFLVPAFFCTLSDAFLPYIGGRILGLAMHFHWCFITHLDIVLPFLIIGIINGWVMGSQQCSRRVFYSLGYHFFHILVSALASLFYLVSFGFYTWWERLNFIFVFLIFVVVIPCTLSDVVVPMFFARLRRK